MTNELKSIVVNICQNFKNQNGTYVPMTGLTPEMLMIILSGVLSSYGLKNKCSVQEIEEASDLELYFTTKYQ
jgi:hypothetical protein